MTTLTGLEFNKQFANEEFYKLITEDCIHNGFEFRVGLNIDTKKFDPSQEERGGIYFTLLKDILSWRYYRISITKISRVRIPDDAQVCFFDTKKSMQKIDLTRLNFKADKIILEEMMDLEIFLESDKVTEQMFLSSIQDLGHMLDCVPRQKRTKKICFEAVKKCSLNIKYVPIELQTDIVSLLSHILLNKKLKNNH